MTRARDNRLMGLRRRLAAARPTTYRIVYLNDWREGALPVDPADALMAKDVITVEYVENWRPDHPPVVWPTAEEALAVPVDDRTPAERYAANCAEESSLQDPRSGVSSDLGYSDEPMIEPEPERWLTIKPAAADMAAWRERVEFYAGLVSTRELYQDMAADMVRKGEAKPGETILGTFDLEAQATACAIEHLSVAARIAADNR